MVKAQIKSMLLWNVLLNQRLLFYEISVLSLCSITYHKKPTILCTFMIW